MICPLRAPWVFLSSTVYVSALQMSDAELQALVMTRMHAVALPGRQVPAAPVRVVRSRWAADPYARGVYSCWRPGNLPGTEPCDPRCDRVDRANADNSVCTGLREELARPEGCVWFAGEAVQESSMLSSSVHGAWLSGIDQAAALCSHFGVPCLLPTSLKLDRVVK
jgi:monoamine oxidase